MKSKILGSLLIATLFSGASLAAPPDLNLLVKHHMTELGADGVTRTVSFAERVYRRDGMVWIERVLPPEAHREADHAKGGHVVRCATSTQRPLAAYRDGGRYCDYAQSTHQQPY